MLECREALSRWGFPAPPKHTVHHAVRQSLVFARHPDLKAIGDALDELVRRRNQAHYDLGPLPAFASPAAALHLIKRSADAIALLDAIEASPARLQQAIASLP